MSWEKEEKTRKYLQVLVYLTGIIIFWRGIWDITRSLPYLENPYISAVVGLLILTLSGYIYYEAAFTRRGIHHFNSLKNAIEQVRGETGYTVKYYDDLEGNDKTISAKHIHKVERATLVIRKSGKESFIPLHRITSVRKGNKIIWKH